MFRGSDLLPLGLALFVLSAAKSDEPAQPKAPALPSSGRGAFEVPRVKTGGQPLAQWFGDRFALALEVLGPNVPAERLRQIALAVVAQWAHETGRGRAEFNFNMGGWRARKTDPYFVARDVQTGAELFRWTAYGDLPNAVHDQLRRLHDRFSSAWALLLAEPNSSRWIEELGRKGYYVAPKGTSQAQHIQNYARAWATNRAELGALAA
jgi:hypothetical protein